MIMDKQKREKQWFEVTGRGEVQAKLAVVDKADILDRATRAGPEKTVAILVDAGVIEQLPWWRSRSVWGAVVVVLASICQLAGLSVDVGAATEMFLSAAQLVGGILAWWGRIHAAQPIDMTRVAPGIGL